MITYEDFKKLEIKIGTVISAEQVENSQKLIKLEIDLGEEKRQILAGIAQFYKPADIVGKQVPVLVNLEPKKMAHKESQGMILAVDAEGKAILLHPNSEVPNGSVVR